MRPLLAILLTVLFFPTTTLADEAAFRQQLFRHISTNSRVFPEALKRKATSVKVVFSIDRDGKLLNAAIDQTSGSPEDDAAVLDGIRRIPSFPRPPDGLQLPEGIKVELVFGPRPGRFAYADLKWPPTSATSGEEIAFRTKIQDHLRIFRPILPKGITLPEDAHAVVAFSLDRDGHLLEAKIAHGFGLEQFDESALEWLRGIQPFPKIPQGLEVPMQLRAEIGLTPTASSDDTHVKKLINGVCRGC